MARLFPLFLRLGGRRVVCVGGGKASVRKIEELVASGARVVVIAPAVEDAVAALGIEHVARSYKRGDLAGAWLVVSATGDADVQRSILEEAEASGTFVLAIDDVDNGSAFSGAVIRRGDMTVVLSSSGEAPALTRLMREVLEQALPDEAYVDAAKALRDKWKREGTPMASRFPELLAELAKKNPG